MKRLALLLLLAAGLFAPACGDSSDSEATATGTASATVAASSTAPGGALPLGTPADEATLRLGYFPNVTHAPAIVGLNEGLFAEALGANVTVETTTFNAGPSVIEALFAGEIDISFIGPNPAINGFVQSEGEALRIIGGSTSAGALFVVHPDSGIEQASDLSGKKVVTPQLGNTQDVALRAWLKANGLDSRENGGDVEVIPTANADALSLFLQGEIDGAWVPEPWGTRLIQEAGGRVFVDERDLWPNGDFVTTHVIVRTAFLEEHPDVVAAFLRGLVSTIEFIDANQEDAKQVTNDGIEAITSAALPQEVIDGAWGNLRFTWDPISSSLLKSALDAHELGYIEDEPNLDGIYALDLLNQVLAESGKPAVQ